MTRKALVGVISIVALTDNYLSTSLTDITGGSFEIRISTMVLSCISPGNNTDCFPACTIQ